MHLAVNAMISNLGGEHDLATNAVPTALQSKRLPSSASTPSQLLIVE